MASVTNRSPGEILDRDFLDQADLTGHTTLMVGSWQR